MSRFGSLLIILTGLFTIVFGTCVGQSQGQQSALAIESFEVGFGGAYRAGTWTPVHLCLSLKKTVSPMVGTVELIVLDGDGVPSSFTTPGPISIEPGQTVGVDLTVRYGRIKNETRIIFRDDSEKILLEKTIESGLSPDYPDALFSARRLVVELGKSSSGAREAAQLAAEEPERATGIGQVAKVDRLPVNPIAYEGVDRLILATAEVDLLESLAKDPARVGAIRDWVDQGGRLLLLTGKNGPAIFGDSSALQSLLPGKIQLVAYLTQIQTIETFTDSNRPIPIDDSTAVRIPATRLASPIGKVLLWEGDLPLIVRADIGLGQVTFFALDSTDGPLAKWEDRPLLMARLLGLPDRSVEKLSGSSTMMHLGYKDLIGQLRSALDRYPSVRPISFGIVIALAIFYLILIGPGDFFFVKRIVRHMGATWITFPLLLIIFSVGAYWIAQKTKGNQVKTNRVEMVDLDLENGLALGSCWASMFSPSDRRYEINLSHTGSIFGAGVGEPRTNLAWLGLPGTGFGGMDPRSVGASLWETPYEFSPELEKLLRLPIQTASTKSFVGRWTADIDLKSPITLRRRDELPVGRITNNTNVGWTDCILVFDRWAYSLGSIDAGKTIPIDGVKNRSELTTLLTGRRLVKNDRKKLRQKSTPYDQTSTNLKYIVRIMSFYRLAGGEKYTGLLNRAKPNVDLSHLVGPDHAILLAWTKTGAAAMTDWVVDSEAIGPENDTHETLLRFIVKVEEEK
jgi:hypothetical protein